MAFATSGSRAVRAWAVEQGISVPPTGRLADDIVERFNREHKGKRYAPGHVDRYPWTAKPPKGRKVTKQINDREVRQAAREAGVPVGERGALRPEVKDAYVLGTLSALVPSGQPAEQSQD